MSRPAIPKELRKKILNKFDGRCSYCGEQKEKLVVDHLIAYERCKNHKEENLMPACHACNNFKHVNTLEQFRIELSYQLHRANERSVNFRFAKKYGQIKETPKPIRFYFEDNPAPSER